jgi:Fe2+ transport system protein FeoA
MGAESSWTEIYVLLGIAAFCFFMAIVTSIPKRRAKKALNKRMHEVGAVNGAYLEHIAGLPISEGKVCACFLMPNAIMVEVNQSQYYIGSGQLTEVSIKKDVEIKEAYVSSAGGALAGGLMFGALGAAVGGRVKKKRDLKVKKFLVIGYVQNEDEKVNIACFKYTRDANIFVKAFANLPKQARYVQL